MVLKSYTKSYVKIYAWQFASLILNLLSMFVVVPYLTEDPVTYGIYSLCISFTIFLAYADLGFIGAGQKYAAEYFAKGKKNQEIEIIGFTSFILLVFILLFSVFFYILSLSPQHIIRGINTIFQQRIASELFLILAVFTPITFLQKLLQLIFGIRMEDFLIQRMNIIGSLFKILSVFWFFELNSNDIVGYFLFTQIVNLIIVFILLYTARERYSYDFLLLCRSLNFNRFMYNKTKSLALTSLFMTFSWILYYELDSVAISSLYGANWVAIYSIGLVVLSFFRNILGILFSPFNVRFNHFLGLGNEEGLKSLYLEVMVILAPVVIFPIIAIAILAKPIVFTWLGVGYAESVGVIQYLLFCNFFAFISYPTNFMLIAKERQNELYLVSVLLPLIFWIGVFFSITNLGIYSFAIFKLVAFSISTLFLYRFMIEYLNISILESIKIIFFPMVFSIFFLTLSALLIRELLPLDKSVRSLLFVALTIFGLLFSSFLVHFCVSDKWRKKLLAVLLAGKN